MPATGAAKPLHFTPMRAHGLALALAGLLATTPHAFAQDADAANASSVPVADAATGDDPAQEPAARNADVPALPVASPATAVDAVEGDAATPPVPVREEVTAPPSRPTDTRTDAERDFDALYGNGEPYNPVADPNLPPPANVGAAYDPWERYNRPMHRFNNAVDRAVARPLALAYVRVVPRPVRLGVSNFFNNLGQPVSAVNALLQGKPGQAAHSLGRFVVNSTLGIAGIFDPASDAKLDNRREDFGQTLGVWGWKRSRYVELPLFGPRTLRDTLGMVADAPLSPVRGIEEDKVRVGLQGLQLVDVRAQLLAVDSLREGAEDDYALVRDAWMQRRDYQIFGDRQLDSDDTLPDYLKDDTNPTVPVDAIPVMPTDGSQ